LRVFLTSSQCLFCFVNPAVPGRPLVGAPPSRPPVVGLPRGVGPRPAWALGLAVLSVACWWTAFAAPPQEDLRPPGLGPGLTHRCLSVRCLSAAGRPSPPPPRPSLTHRGLCFFFGVNPEGSETRAFSRRNAPQPPGWFTIKQIERPETSNSDTATCWGGASQQVTGRKGLTPGASFSAR